MGYPKIVPEERMMTLSPLLTKLARLAEGKYLTVEDTPQGLSQLRMDLYTWWFQQGEKSLWKISRPTPTTLMITRKVQAKPIITVPLDKGQGFARDCLLEHENVDDCMAEIQSAVNSGSLTAAEGMTAYEEWQRVMED